MKICIDTNIFAAIINKEPHADFCKKIISEIERGKITGIISPIAIAEILVGMYRNKDFHAARRFKAHIESVFSIIRVDLGVAEKAARLRAEKDIRLPDALIISTSEIAKAEFLITEDEQMIKINPLKITSAEIFVAKHL